MLSNVLYNYVCQAVLVWGNSQILLQSKDFPLKITATNFATFLAKREFSANCHFKFPVKVVFPTSLSVSP